MDPKTQDDLENLYRQLRILRTRGDHAGAKQVIAQMQELAPDSSLVWEAIGDDALESGRKSDAREAYARARELDPQSLSVDRKFAELVFAMDASLAGIPMSEFEVMASGQSATIQSAILPGLGQITTGEVVQGSVMLGVYLLGWVFLFMIPDGVAGLLRLVGIGRNHASFNAIVFLPISMILFTYIWSLFDVRTKTKKIVRPNIERPKPPVDKDFEI